jgi:hypothetical protein
MRTDQYNAALDAQPNHGARRGCRRAIAAAVAPDRVAADDVAPQPRCRHHSHDVRTFLAREARPASRAEDESARISSDGLRARPRRRNRQDVN